MPASPPPTYFHNMSYSTWAIGDLPLKSSAK
jgi:hypothetical protein